MNPSAQFPNRWLPLLLAAPQLLIVFLFFYWPACQAINWSFHLEQPFGNGSVFVGLDNYARLFTDDRFHEVIWTTIVFTVGGAGTAILAALALAGFADLNIKGRKLFHNLLIWPFALAPAVFGAVAQFFANPVIGPLAFLNTISPGLWAPATNGAHALILVTLAFAWTQLPFNFIIFAAGLQSVPVTYLQAAALDGAGPVRRFMDIQLPMLTPFIFFVLVMNIIHSLTDSFALIDTLTQGGPGTATTNLVYKIYSDGFVGLDLSGSSTLSVILMAVIILITAVQFGFIERRVSYRR